MECVLMGSDKMMSKMKLSIVLLVAVLSAGTVLAQDSGARRDARAIEVLKNMSTYTAKLDQFVIRSTAFTDARLDAGLMVSNAIEIELTIDRPGSMHVTNFDGVQEKELFFHDGTLTIFSSENKFYAQASIPNDIEAAAEFALEEFGIEAPLMDMIYRNITTHLIGSQETVLYLTDKSRVGGVDCHHIAIRSPEVDVQLWVQEGDRPVPRKIMITSKWEGGAPRFFANMSWDTAPDIDSDIFEFQAPEGSTNIGFAADASRP